MVTGSTFRAQTSSKPADLASALPVCRNGKIPLICSIWGSLAFATDMHCYMSSSLQSKVRHPDAANRSVSRVRALSSGGLGVGIFISHLPPEFNQLLQITQPTPPNIFIEIRPQFSSYLGKRRKEAKRKQILSRGINSMLCYAVCCFSR